MNLRQRKKMDRKEISVFFGTKTKQSETKCRILMKIFLGAITPVVAFSV